MLSRPWMCQRAILGEKEVFDFILFGITDFHLVMPLAVNLLSHDKTQDPVYMSTDNS